MPFINISLEEYGSLQEDSRFLGCLEAAGVDNWCGYEYAQAMMEEEED